MTLDEILEFMLARISDEYETSAGSVFYDLFYPIAEQMSILYKKITVNSDNAFALTAVGEYLDRKVAEQSITRKSKTYSTGEVRIEGGKGEIVRQGSLVAADDLLFSVNETAVISDDGYVDVRAVCTTAGAIGNVAAGKINRFPVTLPGLTAVTNFNAFSGGYDEETDEELLTRYLEKVSQPNVSGNKYHYLQWAKDVEGVGEVWVVPLWDGPGTVKVVIADANNQPANNTLISAVRSYIENNRPIGANVTVVGAGSQVINIAVNIKTNGRNFDSIKSDIFDTISEYFSGAALEKRYISSAKICGLIMAVDGVEDCNDFCYFEGSGEYKAISTRSFTIAEGTIPILGELDLGDDND